MRHLPYIGSGPYCYANCFAMMFGARAPSTAVIEFATGSAFGMQVVGGGLPFFDPYGWTPEAGFDGALAAMGWTSTVSHAGDAKEALDRLRAAVAGGPAWVGPVEMGHLRHQPGQDGPTGADHYVVVLEVGRADVLMHDPEGHPYATLPIDDFMAAWRAETVDYVAAPFTMRCAFRQVEQVTEEEAIRRSLPQAVRWLTMTAAETVPCGSLGNAMAAEWLARKLEGDDDAALRGHLLHFAVRVGARRAADAATCLARIGHDRAADVMAGQARLIGALQYPLAVGNRVEAARLLRELAPTYAMLEGVLAIGK